MKRKTALGGPAHNHPAIWEAVRKIPRGRVATYGHIARMVRRPGHARLVGYALHTLPNGADIPWHRVLNARGMVSLSGVGGRRQRDLLKDEGVIFQGDRVDLERYGWYVESHKRSRRRP